MKEYIAEITKGNGIMSMYCYQCEQTAAGTGCDKIGVCGKKPDTAGLQDLLIHCAKMLGCAKATWIMPGSVMIAGRWALITPADRIVEEVVQPTPSSSNVPCR